MNSEEIEEQLTRQSEIITDLVLRMNALEQLLKKKNLASEEEICEVLNDVRLQLMEAIRQHLPPQDNNDQGVRDGK